MTSPAAIPAAIPPLSDVVGRPTRSALEPPLARRVLGEAVLLGVTADALLRDAISGLALPTWVALAALSFLSLTWTSGRRMSRETAGWLLTAVVFAMAVAWRDADMLEFADFLVTVGALLMAAIAARHRESALLAARLRDLLVSAFSTLRTAAAGLLPLAWNEAVAPGEGADAARRAAPAMRATAFAVLLLLIFGALLRGADPIFASLVALPDIELDSLFSHLVVITLFAWLVAGWTRAALDRRPATLIRVDAPFSLSSLEISTALGTLNVLFALYVITQLGWFFGGEAFLRERTGLTAAQYARQGFFQVVLVVLLVVPLLLATRAMLQPGRALARRHTALSLPLLGLLGAIILSAASRMQLYVHYFGLTTDRFYPMAFMLWLALVLVWLALTVLRDRGALFVAGALGSGLAMLLVLNIISPDAVVARVNIARAAAAPGDVRIRLDLAHLARLGGEATPLAVRAVLAPPVTRPQSASDATEFLVQHCAASRLLLNRWGPESRLAAEYREDGAWRRWNAGQAAALKVVAENSAPLRAVFRTTCLPGIRSRVPTRSRGADDD